MIDLNKLENKLDEALIKETTETLNKFLNDKRMENNKQYHVESGEERWNYDSQVPTREIVSYWVMLGKEKIKSFSYHQKAIDYKNKLNNAVNSIKL